MTVWRLIAASVCAGLLGEAADAAPCRLADLQWMTGVWRAGDATTRSEERDRRPGDRLIGSASDLARRRTGADRSRPARSSPAAMALLRWATAIQRHAGPGARGDRRARSCSRSHARRGHGMLDGQGSQAGEHIAPSPRRRPAGFHGDSIHRAGARVALTFTRTGDGAMP